MKQNIIIFTHNDLDALGCLMVINEKFTSETYNKFVYHTNYQNIPDQIIAINEQINTQKIDLVIVCDVSFSTNKLELVRLYGECILQNIPLLYLDHHLYPVDFWNEFPKMKTFYDKNRSASKICLDVLLPSEKDTELAKLIGIIDVYDIWQDRHKAFSVSQRLNNYFWHCIRNGDDIETQAMQYKSRGYKIASDFVQVTSDYIAESEKAIKELEEKNLIMKNDHHKVSIFMSNDYYNDFMIAEHARGQSFVIGINSWGLIKIRVSQHNDISHYTLDRIRLACTGTVEIGHAHAFTWKSSMNFTTDPAGALVHECKRVTSIIAEAMLPSNNKTYDSTMFDDDIPF